MKRTASTTLLIMVGVALLWAAGQRNESLASARNARRPDVGKPLENASPLMVFSTVVLGGFRGLISDILWLRISYLQTQAEYVEIVQLSDWVTKLDPRSAATWSFHAWNMAFNVCAVMSEPEDRWRWVQNGIRLLRDEALAYNPEDAPLSCELAWVYLFKIGGDTDPAHRFYRRRLAEEMTGLLGGPHLDPDRITPEVRRRLNDLKLLPGAMLELGEKYGPLDWRLPETHALYWAGRGRPHAQDARESLLCDRLICQSLAAAFLNGRLDFRPGADVYQTALNPDLLPGALKAYDEALSRHPLASVRTAYANFLTRALVALRESDPVRARALFERLHSRFPSPETAEGYEKFVSALR